MIYAGERRGLRRQKAVRALERVGLADRMDHLPNQLSGGQQQRVSIARAIVNEPLLLSPTSPPARSTPTTTKQVMELFVELHRQGMTVVLVTHDPNIAAYAERVVSFYDGVIVSDETKTKDGNASDRVSSRYYCRRLARDGGAAPADAAGGGADRPCTSIRSSPRRICRTIARAWACCARSSIASASRSTARCRSCGTSRTSAGRPPTTARPWATTFQTDPSSCAMYGGVSMPSAVQQPSQWNGLSNFQANLNYYLFSGFHVEANVKRAKTAQQAALVQIKQNAQGHGAGGGARLLERAAPGDPARRAAVGAAAHGRRGDDRRRARARRAGAADRQEPRDRSASCRRWRRWRICWGRSTTPRRSWRSSSACPTTWCSSTTWWFPRSRRRRRRSWCDDALGRRPEVQNAQAAGGGAAPAGASWRARTSIRS